MAAIVIFAITYLVLAIGRLPGFRIDRTGAAIIGASFMVGVNALSLDEAYRAINFDTIILLFGMMIVVANLRLSGFFSLVAERVVEHAQSVLTVADRDCPGGRLLLGVFRQRHDLPGADASGAGDRRDSAHGIPFRTCCAVAMAANIGSVATITGNPQNMMIGSFSGIPYRDFMAVAGARCGLAGLMLACRA